MTGSAPITVLFLSGRRGKAASAEPGTEPSMRLLGDGLATLGFTVKARRLNRFPINPIPSSDTFYAGFDPVRAFCVLLLDRRVDVVVSIGESNVAIILALARLLRFKPRIVLREISPRGWRKRDWIVDFVLPRVDRVLALTPHQKAWAESRFPLRSPPDLVGFAIDDAFFKPQNCPDGGYVLAVGDDAGRDYDCLIAACRGTPYKLVLRTSSKPVIPDDMRNRVSVLGRQSYIALRNLYAGASVVVVPLLRVDHPSGITALFEGMAMGRCVVVSEVGSTRDIVRDGENGVLVPPGDPLAMRAALTSLMDDGERRNRLGRTARSTIDGELSYATYVQRFAASLRSVVTGEQAASSVTTAGFRRGNEGAQSVETR